ncbi:hypothetical protein [Bradyrhizobium sp.]|uniref:hypothetical protein n=1 Tax=Bradyrhizobium sp. TaxID=376 RepID=UPI003C6FABFE
MKRLGGAPREPLTLKCAARGGRGVKSKAAPRLAACEASLQHTRLLSDSMVVHTAVPVMMCLPVVAVCARGCVSGKRLGMKMDFGFIAALVIAIVAIVDLFVKLPFIAGYAFWVLLGGFLVLTATTKK